MEVQSYAYAVSKLRLKFSFEFGVRSGFSAASQLQKFFVPLLSGSLCWHCLGKYR